MNIPNFIFHLFGNFKPLLNILLLSFLINNSNIYSQQKAFPSAYGAGAYVTGGRGGTVIPVTTLEDTGQEGSLRWALEQRYPRIIVFKVSGTIEIDGNGLLYLDDPAQSNFTVAGQTAPRGGITIKGSIYFHNLENMIWRYVRIRHRPTWDNYDSFYVGNTKQVILDHLSVNYGTDEAINLRNLPGSQPLDEITIQNNLIAESKTGLILGTTGDEISPDGGYISFHNNMIVDISHRFPNLGTSSNFEVINNLIFNWKWRLVSLEDSPNVNHINNYVKGGGQQDEWGLGSNLESYASYLNKIYINDTDQPSIHTSGNIIEGAFENSQADNWPLWRDYFEPTMESTSFQSNSAHFMEGSPIPIKTAQDVAQSLPDDVGAFKTLDENGNIVIYYDEVDSGYINSYKNDDSQPMNFVQENFNGPSLVYPNIPSNQAYPDNDNDGMPNAWENTMGFNPNVDDSAGDHDGNGYTNIEEYLNGVDEQYSGNGQVSAGSNIEVCEGSSASLTATNSQSYIWETGETTQSIIVQPTQTTTYTVTGTDSEGNESTDSVTVTVNPLPIANAGTDQEICQDESITLTASGGDSYEWNTGQTSQSITVTPQETIIYTVTVTNNGCSDTDEVTVTVRPRPSVNAGNDVDIYQNDSITLTASGDGTFVWNTGEETESITVSPTETTTYSVTATLDGCSSSDSVTITVLEPESVTANAGEDKDICENESVTLTASVGPNYLWSTGETTQSIEVSPLATTTYTVTVYNDLLSDTDDVVVNVYPVPVANAGSDEEICQNESITLTASGGDSYEWNTGQTSPSITVAPEQSVTYTVIVTSNGCSDTDDVTVTVRPGPSVNAGNDVEIYQSESITLTAIGDGTFVWNTGEETESITVSPTETTTYSVTATLDGCSSSDSVTVTVLTLTANAGQDKTICENESVTLTASGGPNYSWNTGETTQSIVVSPTETTNYTVTVYNDFISDSDDVIVIVNPIPVADAGEERAILHGEAISLTATGGSEFLWSTNETTQEIIVNPTETTTYTVEVFENGCSDIASVTVIVGVNASVAGDQTICQGETTTLYASGGSYFEWNTGQTTQSIEVSPSQTTTYSVIVSNNSSSDEAEITVNVNLTPAANAGEDVTIESGQNVILTASGGNTYLWSNDETTQNISVSPTDTTIYTVQTFINGCSNSDDVKVTVVQQVNANAGDDMEICLGESTTLTASGGQFYRWLHTNEETASISVSPDETTTYTVEVSNGFSTQTADVIVGVLDCQAINNEPEITGFDYRVYPNPTNGQVQIKLTGLDNVSSIFVSDMKGQVLRSESFDHNNGNVINKQYDLSSLSKGIYLITFKQSGEAAITKKLILN